MKADVEALAESKGFNLQQDSFAFICRVLGYTPLH